MKHLGIDIGSTTIKYVVTDENGSIIKKDYRRHLSKARELLGEIVAGLGDTVGNGKMTVAISGSAGMGFAEKMDLPFVQEVYAEKLAVERFCPGTDAVIELGGEDAKILFLTDGFEMRMNGTCAGGTGAFIDQMATLMQVTPDELNDLAAGHETVYPIASRCGVFAKSDVQPLLNQGARHEDVAAGILYAVVNQTIGGLAQGRRISGKVLYLGGPLHFLPELRRSFDDALGVNGECPEDSLYFVAIGSVLAGVGKELTAESLLELIRGFSSSSEYNSARPLFTSKKEYEDFRERHAEASRGICELKAPGPVMYLGIDAGSTTVKAVMCDENGNIFRPFYTRNNGNPVTAIRGYLASLYRDFPDIRIAGSAVTGYGEQIIRAAFGVDHGIVETVAHYTAASRFKPDVDFILDIGGQDIKCFRIRDGLIDSLFLNEACSSGCGSFLQAFAQTLGLTTEQFSRMGLFAPAPVDLGSRCTVFMNSSVKQAQKDGTSIEDIAAGLSISVVKNALYKVIRCGDPSRLGKNIVVQGGTFLNDCVLRAFEQEIGHEVVRSGYAGIMGAYGCALYAAKHAGEKASSLLGPSALENFVHESKTVTCKGCPNACRLTVNTFSGGKRYIAGNRCSRPLRGEKSGDEYNLFAYKRSLLEAYRTNRIDPGRRTVGIPMGLNNYDLLPFWYRFFTELGFNVLVSPDSNRKLYRRGQHTIPSDTVCYPAKLMHGHVEWLIEQGPDAIFYPDMSYNIDEGLGIDHYNCPVVAYYPQVLKMNMKELGSLPFIDDFMSLADRKQFAVRIGSVMKKYFGDFDKKQIRRAVDQAYGEYMQYRGRIREKGREFLEIAREKDLPVMVLCGRPYHLDPEVNHGIDQMLCDLGTVVITEDSLSGLTGKYSSSVRNQWTYHARMYSAARYIAERDTEKRLHLVQLVSFGCGVDAITTDEVREILERAGRDYTQIKIDEISNMGAVNIRLRSLLAMLAGR